MRKRYHSFGLLCCFCFAFCLSPATASNDNGAEQNTEQFYDPALNVTPNRNISDVPDVHFWTSAQGVAQLDFRVLAPFAGTTGSRANFPQYVNLYGGGINNGDWRGVTVRAFDTVHFINAGNIIDDKRIFSPVFEQERAQMLRDDAFAQSRHSAIDSIDMETSGILWGPVHPRSGKRSDFLGEKRLFHRQFNGQSCLLGPVRITASYIRLDGPITAIGDDVEFNAQRIVINGVDLPPAHWREALTQIVHEKASRTVSTPVYTADQTK